MRSLYSYICWFWLHGDQVITISNTSLHRKIAQLYNFCIRPYKGREQKKKFLEQLLSNFRDKKQLLTFLNNFWETFWEIAGKFLGNLEQLVESPRKKLTSQAYLWVYCGI